MLRCISVFLLSNIKIFPKSGYPRKSFFCGYMKFFLIALEKIITILWWRQKWLLLSAIPYSLAPCLSLWFSAYIITFSLRLASYSSFAFCFSSLQIRQCGMIKTTSICSFYYQWCLQKYQQYMATYDKINQNKTGMSGEVTQKGPKHMQNNNWNFSVCM